MANAGRAGFKHVFKLLRGGASSRRGAVATSGSGLPAHAHSRTYAVGTAVVGATAAAAGGGQVLRLLGYTLPYSWIVGASLASGAGAYAYVTMQMAKQDRQPLDDVILAAPVRLPKGVVLTDHASRKVDVAKQLEGKHAVVAFGALHSSDSPLLEKVARTADEVQKRTGAAVIPCFISLDPAHDKPSDLSVAVGRSGSPSMLALCGTPNELLATAERFKNQSVARQFNSQRDEERKKKGKDVAAGGFVSDHVYVVDPSGRFIALLEKHMPTADMAAAAADSIMRVSMRA